MPDGHQAVQRPQAVQMKLPSASAALWPRVSADSPYLKAPSFSEGRMAGLALTR